MTSKNTNKQASRDAKGRWLPGKSGNPAGRRAGATCHALQMARDAAVEVGLPLLIERAREGDVEAARVLVHVGLPRQKPVAQPITVDLPGDGFTEQARAVLARVAAGDISIDDGAALTGIIAQTAKIDEVTSLREEVERLKSLLDARPPEDGGQK